jgi:hypothetical protein
MGQGGYIGASPAWQGGPTNPYPYLPGAWQIQEAYRRGRSGTWTRAGIPVIGEPYQGGFFAGFISHTADGNATHALIVAPRATGGMGGSYPRDSRWKTSQTTTVGTTSPFDGAANTAAIVTAGIAAHPAAQFCVSLSIGGYTDWYLPSRYELDIAYQNLKPTTYNNDTSWGVNPYSVPARTVNRTTGTPLRTSVAAFQDGGTESFVTSYHWSSTEGSAANAWTVYFIDGSHLSTTKTDTTWYVRAFRKVAL